MTDTTDTQAQHQEPESTSNSETIDGLYLAGKKYRKAAARYRELAAQYQQAFDDLKSIETEYVEAQKELSKQREVLLDVAAEERSPKTDIHGFSL